MKKYFLVFIILISIVFSFEKSFGKGCLCSFYTGSQTPSSFIGSFVDLDHTAEITVDIDTVYDFNSVINDTLFVIEEGNDCAFYCSAFTTVYNIFTFNDTGFYVINFTTCLGTDVTVNFHVMRASPPVSVSGISHTNILQIYPNPTTNTFTIKNLPANETSLLQIIKPNGVIVYSENIFRKNEYIVDANLTAGIYFVQINDVVRKLVIE